MHVNTSTTDNKVWMIPTYWKVHKKSHVALNFRRRTGTKKRRRRFNHKSKRWTAFWILNSISLLFQTTWQSDPTKQIPPMMPNQCVSKRHMPLNLIQHRKIKGLTVPANRLLKMPAKSWFQLATLLISICVKAQGSQLLEFMEICWETAHARQALALQFWCSMMRQFQRKKPTLAEVSERMKLTAHQETKWPKNNLHPSECDSQLDTVSLTQQK